MRGLLSAPPRRLLRRLWLPVLLLAVAGSGLPLRAAGAKVDLKVLLAGLGRSSGLYLDSALQFSCRETILETAPLWRRRFRFEYIYVYDDKKGFVDYRTRLGDRSHRPVNPLEVGVRRFLERAYFWALIFSPRRQRFHRYVIEGRERMFHQDALRLRFEAIPPFKEGVNVWTGTAWVDPRTFQLLRVEAERADLLARKRRIEEGGSTGADEAPAPGSLYATERVVTEFSVEKNGMRFPGRVEILRTIYRVPPGAKGGVRAGAAPRPPERMEEETTIQTYTRYRFFAVRTRDEIEETVSGTRPAIPGR